MASSTYAATGAEPRPATHLLSILGMVLAMVWFGAMPAQAEPPGNDTVEGSTAISVPFFGEQDTTEATTDEVDATLNQECGAPATDASVWYNITPDEDLGVSVLVGGSDYSAGVIVATEIEGELHVETCGPEQVSFFAEAGTTYQLLVFDDQLDGEGNGGNLVLEVEGEQVGPPPEVDLTVDPIGFFHKDGTATVSGTFTCSGEPDFIDLFGHLQQNVGRFTINGFFGLFSEGEPPEENGESDLSCDGSTHSWTATVFSDDGLFRGGKATVEAEIFACGFFTCSSDTVTETIRLRRAR